MTSACVTSSPTVARRSVRRCSRRTATRALKPRWCHGSTSPRSRWCSSSAPGWFSSGAVAAARAEAPAAAAAWAAAYRVASEDAAMPAQAVTQAPLLERDRELDVLEESVERALAGDSVAALIEGPAGIGKSRLLAAGRELAASAGFRVLTARGSDLEREFAFGVVRQLFEPVLTDPGQRARWLASAAQPAARAFEPPTDESAPGDVSYEVLYGLFWLTANIAAEEPLLLAIDDLQWCDTASL